MISKCGVTHTLVLVLVSLNTGHWLCNLVPGQAGSGWPRVLPWTSLEMTGLGLGLPGLAHHHHSSSFPHSSVIIMLLVGEDSTSPTAGDG